MVGEKSGREQVAAETSRLGGAGPAGHVPPQVYPTAALSARANEVQALLRMMVSARANQTTRAWQQLPRELRRRAASHNLLRLPRRLRAKAVREMQASKTEPRTRAALRLRMANHPATAAGRRRERLRDRAARPLARWLETHRWHAKRFRMTRGADDKRPAHHRLRPNCAPATEALPIGLVVAQTPHQKSQRTTWRAACDAVVLHDASYYAWFRLDSSTDGEDDPQAAGSALSAVLQTISVASPGAGSPESSAQDNLFLSGCYAHETVLFSSAGSTPAGEPDGPLVRTVAPALVLRFTHGRGATAILRTHPSLIEHVTSALHRAVKMAQSTHKHKVTITPLDLAPHPSLAVPHERSSPQRVRDADKPLPKAARGAKGESQTPAASWRTPCRQAHADQVRAALKFWSGTGPNAARKRQNTRGRAGQAVTDGLMGPTAGWNTFTLTGPGAGRLAAAVLLPTEDSSPSALRALHLISQKLLPAQVPRGYVLPLRVRDPRLSFPPKLPYNEPLAARNAAKRAKDEFGRPQPQPRPRARKRKHQHVAGTDVEDDGMPSSVKRFKELFADIESSPGSHGASTSTSTKILHEFFHCPPGPPCFTQGDIDARRARLAGGLVPGAVLKPGRRDQDVPVILIRTDVRTSGVSPPLSASPHVSTGDGVAGVSGGATARESDAAAGWTLLVPRGWGMAFWRSLVHPNTRVAAQDAQAHLALEARSPTFPDDFVATSLGLMGGAGSDSGLPRTSTGTPFEQVWRTRALVARRDWDRHPSGKRSAVAPDADAGADAQAAQAAVAGTVGSEPLDLELFPHHTTGWRLAARMARARALSELTTYLTPLPELLHTRLEDATPWLAHVTSSDPAKWRSLAYALFSPQAAPTTDSTNLATALRGVLSLASTSPAIRSVSSGPIPASTSALDSGTHAGLPTANSDGLKWATSAATGLSSAFVLVHIECVRKGNLAAPASVLMVPQNQDHLWRSALYQLALDGKDEVAKQSLQDLELDVPPASRARAKAKTPRAPEVAHAKTTTTLRPNGPGHPTRGEGKRHGQLDRGAVGGGVLAGFHAEHEMLGSGREGRPRDARVGTLTSAGFSLTHGRAHGVGAISLVALCQLYLRDEMYVLPGSEGASGRRQERRGRNAVDTHRLVAVQAEAGQPRRAAMVDPLVL